MRQYTKDPEATITYEIDWSEYLTGLGNITIQSSAWTVPDGLTVVEEDHDDTAAVVKVSGGTVNEDYTLYNKITTSGGGVDRRAILLQVRDAATFEEPGEFATALAAIRAVLKGTATKTQKQYSIAGRQVVRYDMSELLALEQRFTRLANKEARAANVRRGAPVLQNIKAGFSNPR